MYIPVVQTELYLYDMEQFLNSLLVAQIYDFSTTSFITILVGGLLTSLSPCMFSSLPITIAYLNKQRSTKWTKYLFLLGIITSLVIIGLLAVLAKDSYWKLLSRTPLIIPISTIVIGLSLLNLLDFKFKYPTSLRTTRATNFMSNPLIEPYFLGVSTGLAVSPCSTPILMTLIIWITTTQNFILGVSFVFIYSIGYITPVIACIISLEVFQKGQSFNPLWNELISWAGSTILFIGSYSLGHQVFRIYTMSA
jgi:cytochrome c-type biogenesis protein